MTNYNFLSCRKEKQSNGDFRLFVEGSCSYQMSHRLVSIIERLRRIYSEKFKKAAPLDIGLIITPRNGASGSWVRARSSTEGPIFLVELDPTLEGSEDVLAHELAHPILKLLGVPTGVSNGQISERIGNEFTSTSHHPFVFDLLNCAGYGDNQRASYLTSAVEELDKLSCADFSTPTYTASPGQTWLALWYFNFYLMAPEKYNALYLEHKRKAPGVADKMDLVRESWMAATKNKGAIKRNAPSQCTRSFQSHLFNKLDLEGRMTLKSFKDWKKWLF